MAILKNVQLVRLKLFTYQSVYFADYYNYDDEKRQ